MSKFSSDKTIYGTPLPSKWRELMSEIEGKRYVRFDEQQGMPCLNCYAYDFSDEKYAYGSCGSHDETERFYVLISYVEFLTASRVRYVEADYVCERLGIRFNEDHGYTSRSLTPEEMVESEKMWDILSRRLKMEMSFADKTKFSWK